MKNPVSIVSGERSRAENLYKFLWENTSDIVVELDKDGICLNINQVLPGDNIDEIIGQNLFQSYLTKEHEILFKNVKNKLSNEGKVDDFLIAIDHDQAMHWKCQVMMLDPDNVDSSLFIIARDVSQQQIFEKSLQSSEQYHRGIFESVSDGLIITDLLGSILNVNPAYCKMLGYERDELLNTPANKLLHPEHRSDVKKMRNQFLHRGKINLETTQLHKNQETAVSVEINSSVFKHEKGLVFLSVVRDISQRKKEQRELALSEFRYRTLFAESPDMMYSIELKYRGIKDVNNSFLSRLGYTEEEVLGENVYDFYQEESVPHAKAAFEKYVVDYLPFEGERTFICKDGSSVPAWIKCSSLVIGDEVFLYVVSRDLTERKAMEGKIRDLQREHQHQLEHVTRLNTLGEMATGLAHELNQPLSAITNYLSGCLRRLKTADYNDEAVIKGMQLAIKESSRASSIIDWLRAFVKNNKQQAVLLDFAGELEEVFNLLAFHRKNIDINFHVNMADNMPKISFDKIQLQQVLINLLNNAIEAAKQASKKSVTITVTSECDENIEIYFVDNGPGMSESVRYSVFDPFFTTKTEGMGMGLAICRSIVSQYNGKLALVESNEQGTSFCLSLLYAGNY